MYKAYNKILKTESTDYTNALIGIICANILQVITITIKLIKKQKIKNFKLLKYFVFFLILFLFTHHIYLHLMKCKNTLF